jgi:phosphopentomutase
VRSTFADIGATVLDFYDTATPHGRGTSFLSQVREADG